GRTIPNAWRLFHPTGRASLSGATAVRGVADRPARVSYDSKFISPGLAGQLVAQVLRDAVGPARVELAVRMSADPAHQHVGRGGEVAVDEGDAAGGKKAGVVLVARCRAEQQHDEPRVARCAGMRHA